MSSIVLTRLTGWSICSCLSCGSIAPLDKVTDNEAILASVERYKRLIGSLPSSSKYLLCYVLDLLNVFARNCDTNLMPASNLAVVFQPGLLRGPDALIAPNPPLHGRTDAIPMSDHANNGARENSQEPGTAAFSPPSFPSISRTPSNPSAPHMAASNTAESSSSSASTAASGAMSSHTNFVTAELQRKQDEIKINQEVLEFLIDHQDHFVALPESQMSSAEPSPVSPASSAALSGMGPSRGRNSSQVSAHGQGQAPSTYQHAQPQQMPQHQSAVQQYQTQSRPAGQATVAPQSYTAQGSASQALQQHAQYQQAPPITARQPPQSLHASPARHPDEPHINTRSQSVSQERSTPAPVSTARAPAGPMTATFPLSHPTYQQQQQPQAAPPADTTSLSKQDKEKEKEARKEREKKEKEREKEREREEREHRQPRKLKKGRTPTQSLSGTATPLSPPASNVGVAYWDPAQSQQAYSQPASMSSSPVGAGPIPTRLQTGVRAGSPLYDDDVPLSAHTIRPAGPASSGSPETSPGGVKRSRTLPLGGARGPSPRSVCVFSSDLCPSDSIQGGRLTAHWFLRNSSQPAAANPNPAHRHHHP